MSPFKISYIMYKKVVKYVITTCFYVSNINDNSAKLWLWLSTMAMLHSGVFVSKLIDLLLYVASDGTNDPNNNPAKKETILCVLFPCNTTTTTPEVTTSSAAAGNTTSTAGEMATSVHTETLHPPLMWERRPWVLWASCLWIVHFTWVVGGLSCQSLIKVGL